MDWLAVINEYGFLGAAVIVEGFVIWWLVGWIRQLVEARQRDSEKFADRAVEREREMTGALNDLTKAVEGWARYDKRP